jgi:hemimethylated DNA binding protein
VRVGVTACGMRRACGKGSWWRLRALSALRSALTRCRAHSCRAAACGPGVAPGAVEDAAGVARLTRDAFRAAAALDSSERLDRGFDALRLLNDVYTPALALRAAARDEHADRNGVLYSVGTTFRHKVFGYTGVVVGWDKTCARTPAWVEAFTTGLTKGADQPFYLVLPDARDCLALFGAVRESKYVAQENIEPLGPALVAAATPGAPAPARGIGGIGRRARVVHPDLPRFFVGFSRTQGRYLPRREVAYEFPDEADDPAGSLEGVEAV